MGWFEGQLWRWTLTWKRQPSTEEQEHILALKELLQQLQLVRDASDQLLWCGKPSFATKSLTAEECRISLGNVAVDHLASTVWMNIAPPRVKFMVWLALLGKLHTKDILVKKRIIAEERNLCSFCSMHTETCDHLLMHCSVACKYGVT